jgi:hypothetical protein
LKKSPRGLEKTLKFPERPSNCVAMPVDKNTMARPAQVRIGPVRTIVIQADTMQLEILSV